MVRSQALKLFPLGYPQISIQEVGARWNYHNFILVEGGLECINRIIPPWRVRIVIEHTPALGLANIPVFTARVDMNLSVIAMPIFVQDVIPAHTPMRLVMNGDSVIFVVVYVIASYTVVARFILSDSYEPIGSNEVALDRVTIALATLPI